ncbi:hypothetical protein LCGC14_0925290 [marine sediment metagenome]|uniref:Uncharacterized protein n=1 Tax=marine sediment metagenome TaxID=412755 RepID=A0A0F9RW66_9ZZZZ
MADSRLVEKHRELRTAERRALVLGDAKKYHAAKIETALLVDTQIVAAVPYNSRPAYLRAELEVRLHEDSEYQQILIAHRDILDEVDSIAEQVDELEDDI